MKFTLIKALSLLLNALPNRVVLLLGDALGLTWYFLIPIRKATVVGNLTTAFGDTKSPAEIRSLARRSFRHIGRIAFEAIRSIVWSKEDFRRNVPFEGLEHLQPYLDSKQGGFLVSLHLGCWELSPGAGSSQGVPVDVIAKYARQQGADPFLQWFRQRLGVNVIPETRSTQQILDSVAAGRWIGFMLDQFMGPPAGIPVTFFGKLAGTTASLAALSEKHAIPCVLAYTYRDAKGWVHTVIEPIVFPAFSSDLTERVWQKTQFLNDLLESKVRQYPDQWMWLHRRWKPFNGTPKWNLTTPLVPVPA